MKKKKKKKREQPGNNFLITLPAAMDTLHAGPSETVCAEDSSPARRGLSYRAQDLRGEKKADEHDISVWSR